MLTALCRDHAVRAIGIVRNPVVLWLLTIVFGLYYVTSQEMGIGVATLWSFGGDQWRTCSTLRAVASALPDDDVGDWFTLDGTLLCDSSRKE
jgi:hypothetical protein